MRTNCAQQLLDFSPPAAVSEEPVVAARRCRFVGCQGTCDRSALLPGGFVYEFRKAAGLPAPEIPPDVAYYFMYSDGWEPVTYQDLLDARKKEQRERLERIRFVPFPKIRPAWLWVFFVEGFIYGGWWCYITTRYGEVGRGVKSNVHYKSDTARALMESIPLGIDPAPDNFHQWMEKFAEAHPRKAPQHDERKAGTLLGWTDGERFHLSRPEDEKKQTDNERQPI